MTHHGTGRLGAVRRACRRSLSTLSLQPVALAAAAAALAGCGRGGPPPEPPRLVDVGRAAKDVAVDTLVVLGDVRGEKEVELVSDLPEKVVALHVQEGAAVAAGDPILTLDPRLVASDLAQAEAAVEAARATRDRLRADLERVRGLVGSGAAAQAQLDALVSELRGADAQVAQLSAAGRAAGTRRARSTLRAPFAGTVAALAVDEGDLAAPQVPVALLVAMDRVEIDLHVAEADFVRLREGMPAEVRLPALPEVMREGSVASLSPVLDRRTRTGTATVVVDNADHLLRPGMVAEVAFALDRRDDVVMVPGPALVMLPETARTGKAAVFVLDGAVARRRTVSLGRRYGDRVEIAEGLEAGERIVVRGQHLLRDGSPVRVVDADEGAPPAAPPEERT